MLLTSGSRRRRVRVLLVFMLLGVLALAGCVDCGPTGPPVTARGVGEDAATEGGFNAYALSVRVVDEPGGPPLQGAGVVVYWSSATPEDFSNVTILVGGGGRATNGPGGQTAEGGGGVLVASPGATDPTPGAGSVVKVATGPDGVAVARVPTQRVVGVVVAKDGYTEEWIPALAAGDGATGDTITVPLYKASLSVPYTGTWGPGAASTGKVTNNNYEWEPSEIPFSENDATRRGYIARLSNLHATLRWNNGAAGGGDLALGLGPVSSQPAYVEDAAEDVAPGDHVEEISFDAARLREVGVLGSPTGFIGPATASGFVGPFGLSYALDLEAEFDTAAAKLAACANSVRDESGDLPGASVPLAWTAAPLALVLAGLAVRRRR